MMKVSELVLILGVLIVAGCDRFSHTVEIPRSVIQGAADELVPMDVRDVKDVPFEITISAIEVLLDEESNQVGMAVSFTAEAPPAPPIRPPGGPLPPLGGSLPTPTPPGPIEGTISVSGEVVFEGSSGAFYFKSPKIRKLEGGNLPEAAVPPFSKAVEKLLEKYFGENPVYTLKDGEMASKAAKALLKSIEVRDDALHITLGL